MIYAYCKNIFKKKNIILSNPTTYIYSYVILVYNFMLLGFLIHKHSYTWHTYISYTYCTLIGLSVQDIRRYTWQYNTLCTYLICVTYFCNHVHNTYYFSYDILKLTNKIKAVFWNLILTVLKYYGFIIMFNHCL